MNHIKEMVKIVENYDINNASQPIREYKWNPIYGMTGLGILDLLNQCVSYIPDGKIYLEVGSHQGKTLLGAALNNPGKKLVAVDNYSDFGNKEHILRENIEIHNSGADISLYVEDCWDFFKDRVSEYSEKISVYFYDGHHGYKEQYDGLIKAIDMLDDEAIVFVDDTYGEADMKLSDGRMVRPPQQATFDVIKDDSRFKLIREFTEPLDHEGFWMGLMVLGFKR